MSSSKRAWAAALGLGFMVVLAGCASANPYGGSGSPAATSTSVTSSASVKTATATVGGASKTILIDGQGKTLYYFDSDSAAQAACTGSCTQTWPPLLSSSGSVQGPSGLPSSLVVVSDGNGKQVEYNGHPLYTYSGDTAPGQTNGDGVLGKWHVATPSIPVNTNGGNNGY
jgi:predicted lipoprotein with Yx(FWY)xxD motif